LRVWLVVGNLSGQGTEGERDREIFMKIHRVLCIAAMTYVAAIIAINMSKKGYFEWGEKP